MMLPLYKETQKFSRQVEGRNEGLYFEKFFDEWEVNHDQSQYKMDKKNFFKNINHEIKNNYLTDYFDRRYHLARMLDGRILRSNTLWRLVSGLGAAHPAETGFIWHRTLGIPYLPGSSLKGALRAWLTHWEKGESERIHELFGDTDTSGQGRLIIFDALPVSPVKLDLDVMNSHYAPYYDHLRQRDVLQTNPPADYYSPNPVFFLTVAPGQVFEFMLAQTPGLGTQEDLDEGVILLKEALSTIGVGAKTAVGYGIFDTEFIDQTKSIFTKLDEEEEKARLKDLTLFERRCYRLESLLKRYTGQEKEEIKGESMLLFGELRSLSESEKIRAAKILKEVWQTIGEWEGKLSDKQVKKVALIKELLAR
jgi:CRISPR-associated protein Cmr6